MLLDPDLSREAIGEKIADPLSIDPVEAAVRIRQVVDARMGQEVFNEVALKGHDPREFVLIGLRRCRGHPCLRFCSIPEGKKSHCPLPIPLFSGPSGPPP